MFLSKEFVGGLTLGFTLGATIYGFIIYLRFNPRQSRLQFSHDIVEGWKIYRVPRVNLTWKSSSPHVEKMPSMDPEHLVFRVPEAEQMNFTFYG